MRRICRRAVGALCALLVMPADARADPAADDGDVPTALETVPVEPLAPADATPAVVRAGRAPPVIEEIVVTVNKRVENVQEVSSAVSAFSGKMLAENNVQDFASLAEFTPGMVTRGEDSISIRGVGKARGGTSPVAFHTDGFILEGRAERFYDLAAIEVVRGPSGTVYGRNATAGAINVKWAPPELVYGAGADVRFGSYDEREMRAFVNLPLFGEDNPLLAARAAAMHVRRNGHFDNLLADDGDDPAGVEDRFARLYLTSEPVPDLRLALRVIENRSGGTFGVNSPSLQTRQSGILEEFGAQPLSDDLLEVRSLKYRQLPAPWAKLSRVAGDITWNLTGLPVFGDVDIDITGGRMRTSSFSATDLDGTEEPIAETINDERTDASNVEIRFTSQYSSKFKWLVGAFWYDRHRIGDMHVDARTREDILLFIVPALEPLLGALPWSPTERIFDADVDYVGEQRDDRSTALFVNFSSHLGDLIEGFPQVELFSGLRYNRDKLHLKTEREVIYITDYRSGLRIPFPIDDKSTDIRGSFDEITGELGAKWFHDGLGDGFIEDGMLYAKYARGYKPGTVQLLARDELNEVDPEILNMIELGWKAALLRRSLVLNLTAFQYDYRDLQVGKIIITGQKLENAGSATIRGFEAELQWTPLHALYLQLAVSLLDARFESFCGRDEELEEQAVQPGCTGEEPHNFAGARLNDAPPYSVTGLARYTFDLDRYGRLTPAISVNRVDTYARRPYGNPIDDVPGYTKTDIRMVWESPRDFFRVEGFVENLEDHDDIFADHFSMPDPGAYSLLSVAPARTFGLRVEARF